MLTRESVVRSENGLVFVHIPSTVRGVSTAGLNSALPVRVRRRPVWNSSSTGDPVMVREGIGTKEESEYTFNSYKFYLTIMGLFSHTLNCDVV